MIYVRAFKKEDLSAFAPIEPGISRFDDEFAQAIEDSDLSITGIKRDGTIVGCGGVHPDGEQGEMWLRLSSYAQTHRLEILRWLKEGLAVIENTFGFSQLNVSVKCCFSQSIKLVEYLGFRKTQEVTCEGQKWSIFSKAIKQ